MFDPPAIQRMELLVLDALNWRMRSITPFSFISFFVSLFQLKDPPLTQALKDRASNIIFQARNGNKTEHETISENDFFMTKQHKHS